MLFDASWIRDPGLSGEVWPDEGVGRRGESMRATLWLLFMLACVVVVLLGFCLGILFALMFAS